MRVQASAEQSLRNGDLTDALADLQEQIRARPDDPALRIFLFQLLCVLGHWERALKHLDVAARLDPGALAMAQTYREAVRCEMFRAEVFEGKRSPLVVGEPDQWLALLIESLLLAGRREFLQSQEMRGRAFDDAPTSSGDIDGRAFDWIADADSRLGPVLEVIINGRYYWMPFSRVSRITLEAPADLRDLVWMPAHLQFQNGGDSVALVPTRYPGSEFAAEGSIALGRKTVWQEVAADIHYGLGQRIIATDAAEVPLAEIRTISIAGDIDRLTDPAAA